MAIGRGDEFTIQPSWVHAIVSGSTLEVLVAPDGPKSWLTLGARVLAITGSTGKTSTEDLPAAMVRAAHPDALHLAGLSPGVVVSSWACRSGCRVGGADGRRG